MKYSIKMESKVRTIYSCRLNKGFCSNLQSGHQIWQVPEDGCRVQGLRRWEYKNQDEHIDLNRKVNNNNSFSQKLN